MNRRTDVDFSRHELTVKKLDGVLIHTFKRPDSNRCSLVFINTCGVMTVTGDFGNWVFCREFHPSPDGYVSGSYWDEKLEMSSEQKSHKYDSEETLAKIKRFKEEFEDFYGRKMTEEESDWVESLEGSYHDEHEYIYTAYRENPSTIDCESVPFGEKRHFWLAAVYDGFDCICERLKEQETKLS